MAALTATLHLTRVQIAAVGDPTTNVSAGSAGSIGGGGQRTDDRQVTGSFRQYANGVTRLILGTGKTRTQNIVLRALTPAQVAMVRSLTGRLCVLRDTYGRVTYGSFIETTETTLPLSSSNGKADTVLTDVGFTFTEVTYSEVV